MSENAPQESSVEAPSKPDRGLSRGQKLLLVVAVVFVAVGFALKAAAGDAAPAGPETQLSASSLSGGAPAGALSSNAATDDSIGSAKNWSPFFMKGGFSFFLAFCMGYALRTFFKISAVFIGLAGLLLFGLAKAGVIEPDWGKMEGWYDVIANRVKQDAASMKDFISGSLPSAGFATLGLFTGFKKG